jgi:D-tagatose-1,6-bisphosphate aldolase subunit GatZ/KbaZ
MEPGRYDPLSNLRRDHLEGRRGGLFAICSAHREVLAAAIATMKTGDEVLLVEATASQVNQFGGYTGLTPAGFANALRHLADEMGFTPERLVIGADHLGPYVWRENPSTEAMAKAVALARLCVAAGFRKIHLDTGFGCADDGAEEVPLAVAAERAAFLCAAAEEESARLGESAERPLYVIGAEVPPPGGALEDPEALAATPVGVVVDMVALAEEKFRAAGLTDAWRRVVAVVVQPGVDFGDEVVAPYDPRKAGALSGHHANLPGIMTFEVHATDYQDAPSLARMVADHFPLLKVGPGLTNAFREAVFALAHIESEWLEGRRGHRPSMLRQVLERTMKQSPGQWRSHYRGPRSQRRFLRSFSLRDRLRCYWGHPDVAAAQARLLENLAAPIPRSLVHQFFPDLFEAVRSGELSPTPPDLIRRRIQEALRPYVEACR